ncbi:hypothetical protein [Nostoc sp. NMS8]|nr:hypothetical protein [Nostoc sp. NMS8]MBN3963307.1 hypothetical protein [Nostoc sp. NMS8]
MYFSNETLRECGFFIKIAGLEAIAYGTDTIKKHNFGRVSDVTRNKAR